MKYGMRQYLESLQGLEDKGRQPIRAMRARQHKGSLVEHGERERDGDYASELYIEWMRQDHYSW